MIEQIKFGTDGWRSIIADGFTFANVERLTQALCDYLKKSAKNKLVVIAYDGRFFSDRFAETAARVVCGNGFKVELSNRPTSSPVLSYAVKSRNASIGIMITASHNPPKFNGFKLKASTGGSVDEQVTNAIEYLIDAQPVKKDTTAKAPIKKVDFVAAYVSFMKSHFRGFSLKNLKGQIVFDAMNGPGAELLQKIIGSQSKLTYVRGELDPLFSNSVPEPIEHNLDILKEAVRKNKAAVGIAVDGDVDRIGLVDDEGNYLPPHSVMPLLLMHLTEIKKLKGKVIQTRSMGYVTQRMAAQLKLPFEEVPVGFKYIADRIRREKVLLGGEESGGYGVGLWFPERDGILNALLIMELLNKKKVRLSDLTRQITSQYGTSVFKRVDFPLSTPVDKKIWTEELIPQVGPDFVGLPVKTIHSDDGLKIVREDDSWLLMRPSGTEPLLRTYAEAATAANVDALLQGAQTLLASVIKAKSQAAAAARAKKKKESRAKASVK